MSNRNAFPHRASPDGVLGRRTVTALAYAAAVAVVAASLPTILTPLPVQSLLPPPPHVVARTPVQSETLP